MNQDQKAALKMTMEGVWEDLKFPATVISFLLYFFLLAIYTQFMLVLSAGCIASAIVYGVRVAYLNNLAYVTFRREAQERYDRHLSFLGQHNLDLANKGVNNATD